MNPPGRPERIAFICRPTNVESGRGRGRRRINLVGLNRRVGGGYGDCKRAWVRVNRLARRYGCPAWCAQSVWRGKSVAKESTPSAKNARIARSGVTGANRSPAGVQPNAQCTNGEGSVHLRAVRADAISVSVPAQWARWARTGPRRSGGSAGRRACRCGT